jgi:hypothetical protein
MIFPNQLEWTVENAQNVYFRLDTNAFAGSTPDYPQGTWLITGIMHDHPAKDCVEATHVESGKVRPITLNWLGYEWKPVAVKVPSNPCAECDEPTPKDDYLCEECRGRK